MLVIGCGNPLRGDDRLAWAVTAAVERTLPDVPVQAVHALTPELTDAMANKHLVVFVDARVGPEPGRVRVERIEPEHGPSSAHAITPAALLEWTVDLYGRCPEAVLISVDGERFGFGETLSPRVEHAVAAVLETIGRLRDRRGLH